MGDDGARPLSPFLSRRLVRRDRRGGFVLDLSGDDREMLRMLVPKFVRMLDDPDQPALRRLFPPAYADPEDHEREEEYQRLMQEDLVERHRQELELVVSTASEDHLTEEQLLAWSRALNGLRLVLGTVLDVSEDQVAGTGTPEEAIYHWLSFLLEASVSALAVGI